MFLKILMSSESQINFSDYKLDASANGCTGMFYRTEPEMNKTSNDPSWPRNGTVLKGYEPKDHPGWVKFENGFWMPLEQHNKTVCHKLN